MDHFELHSEYKPTGDQPQAIEKLVRGVKEGNQFETLLGVTGSGKTFTMANVIAQLNKPTLVLAHNNIDYQEIEIFRQEENVLKQISLNIKDKIIVEQSDIIIFEIDYLEDIPQYQIICPEIKDKAVFVGFPNGLSGEECMTPRYIIRGEINDLPSDSIIQVNSERSFETYLSDAKSNISGYSGCGIFVESEDIPYLCGIITELGSAEGLFAFVNGISIFVIDNALCQEKNIHLPNTKWCSFKKFIKATLRIFEEPLANICSVQIPEIIDNVTPNSILEHCGNKIVWPYSNKSILKQEVWEQRKIMGG